MPIFIGVNNAHKPAAVSVAVGGAWKSVQGVWQAVAGAWRQVSAAQQPEVWQFVGSSTTAGARADVGFAFTDRLAALRGWDASQWYVDGVGSSTIPMYKSRFTTSCDVHYNADAVNTVVLQHGSNDIGTAVEVFASLVDFCEYVKALHPENPWRIIILTTPTPRHGFSAATNARMEAYNSLYQDDPEFHNGVLADGVVWLHTVPELVDSTSDYISDDGKHMTTLGHNVFAEGINDEIDALASGAGRTSDRPQVSITKPSPWVTVFGPALELTVDAVGASNLEMWAGHYDPTTGSGVQNLAKIGDTVLGNSGSWTADTSQWPDGSTVLLFAVAQKENGVRQIAKSWVSVYRAAAAGAPYITRAPSDMTVQIGEASALTVEVGGNDLSYQWQIYQTDWTDIAGATAAAFARQSWSLEHGGAYRCVVTNAFGAVTTCAAHVAVTSAGLIAFDSFSGSGALAGTVTDVAGALAWNPAPNFTLGSGVASTGSITTALLNAGVSGGYRVSAKMRILTSSAAPGVAFYANGTSEFHAIRINGAAVQVRDNAGAGSAVCGLPASLTVGQWYDMACDVIGDSVTVYLDGLLLLSRKVSKYMTNTYCGLRNGVSGSVEFDDFKVKLLGGPAIVDLSQSQSVVEGSLVSLYATATGTGELTYQWQKDGQDILGATASSLQFAAVAADSGSYTVRIGDATGSTSATVGIDVRALSSAAVHDSFAIGSFDGTRIPEVSIGAPWTVLTGSGEIANGRLTANAAVLATVDSGISDCDVVCKMRVSSFSIPVGLSVRTTDANNRIRFYISGSKWILSTGAATVVLNTLDHGLNVNEWFELRARMQGQSIKLYINGKLVNGAAVAGAYGHILSTQETVTSHGFYIGAGTGTVDVDSFTVTPL